MAKICLVFWSLCCIGEISGWNLMRRHFVPEVKGDGEKPESSQQASPSTKAPQAPPSSFPLDSWNHPSPAEQISFQDKVSQKRQQVWAAPNTLHAPLCGSATQLRAGGEGIQPGSVDQPPAMCPRCANTKPRSGLEHK